MGRPETWWGQGRLRRDGWGGEGGSGCRRFCHQSLSFYCPNV